jgi:HK97 family phage portal protein
MGLFRRNKSASQIHRAVLGKSIGLDTTPQAGRVDPKRLMASYQFWTHRCITLNAQAAASVPLRLFAVGGSKAVTKDFGTLKRVDHVTKAFLQGRCEVSPSDRVKHTIRGVTEDMTEIQRHPLLDLLADVNPWADGYMLREGIYSDLQATGQAFIHVVDSDTPEEMWRVLPHITRVVPSAENFVSHFETGEGSDKQRLEKEDILWFRLFDPTNPWGGLGPLEAWLRTVLSSEAIQKFQYELLTRFGVPDYLLTSDREFTQTQSDAIRKGFRRLFGNMGRRKESVATIGGGAKLERLTETNRELEFNDSLNGLRNSIGQAFGVPQSILTTDDVNRANAREGNVAWYKTTLWPWIQRVESVLNEQLVPMFGDRLVIVHDNPIPDDRGIRIDERASQLQSGWTLNEIRADDGAEAIDDPLADEPMISSGAILPLSIAVEVQQEAVKKPEPEPVVEPVEEEVVELEGATPEEVLAGQQITAALDIVTRFTEDKIPRDTAIQMLVVFYNLTPEQAAAIVPEESFEPPEPVIPPGLAPPGEGPPNSPQEPAEEPEEEPAPPKESDTDRLTKLADIAAGLIEAAKPAEDKEKPLREPDLIKSADVKLHSDLCAKAVTPEEEAAVAAFAASVSEVFRRHVRRVVARLKGGVLVPNPAEPGGVGLAQIDTVLTEDDIDRWAAEYATAARRHIELRISQAGAAAIAKLPVSVGFDLSNVDTLRYLKDTAVQVGGSATAAVRGEIRKALIEGIEKGEGLDTIATRIEGIAGGDFPKWKATQIARTEIGFAAGYGTEFGWMQSGVVSGKYFQVSSDPCEWCRKVAEMFGDGLEDAGEGAPEGSTVFRLGTPFFTRGRHLTLPRSTGGAPRMLKFDYRDVPDGKVHPNCRCSILPVMSKGE